MPARSWGRFDLADSLVADSCFWSDPRKVARVRLGDYTVASWPRDLESNGSSAIRRQPTVEVARDDGE